MFSDSVLCFLIVYCRGGSRQKSDWCFTCIKVGVVGRGRTGRSDHGYGLSLLNRQCMYIYVTVMEKL